MLSLNAGDREATNEEARGRQSDHSKGWPSHRPWRAEGNVVGNGSPPRNGGTFRAIGYSVGFSDRRAQILWDDYWANEHVLGSELAETIRAGLTARYRLLRDTALAIAKKPNIRVTEDDPISGTFDLAELAEKVQGRGLLHLVRNLRE